MKKLVPVNDLVLIRLAKAEETSKGGIVLPDTAKPVQSYGEILAVGPGFHTDQGVFVPMKLEVGSQVLFARGAWNDVPELFGEDLVLVREGSVLALAK